MKKKLLILLTLAVMVFGLALTSCIKKKDKLDVVAATFPCYDFARAVVGDSADLTLLVKPGTDIHSYEPSVQDILKINNCDVFIYIGGESDEAWVDNVLANVGKSVRVVRLIEYVSAVEEEIKEGMQEEEEEEDEGEETEYDEHIWTSPANAIVLINALLGVFSDINGSKAAEYSRTAASYISEITAIQNDIKELVATATIKKIVVADRFPFRYLADEFGLDYAAALVGCSHDIDISLATITFLIEFVKAENIPCVYYVELSDQKAANTIAEETGCQTALLHSCERPTLAQFNDGVTYASLMRDNIISLAKGVV